MNKVLILDKSAFHGTACSELVRFVECHRVILPYALCVECAISQKGNPPRDSKDPKRLMQKLLEVVKNGAYAGKSPGKIVEEERSRNAAIASLVDMEETQTMRKSKVDEEPDLEKVREECDKAFKPTIDFVERWADQYYKNIRKKELEKKFREEVDESDLVGRLRKWLLFIDGAKDDILGQFLGNRSSAVPADRWEWQMLRLSLAWGTELACTRNKSGPSFENHDISNDIFDIYHVSHLSQADGVVAGDKKLVQPLAMAAFASKDVFASIDDVPYRYCKENDMDGVSHGNAEKAAARHGWFVGHFVDNDAYRHTTDVEVKWWTHKKSEEDKPFEGNYSARSMSILIEGAFRFEFRRRENVEEVLLEKPGDYVVWLPNVEHRGFAQIDNTIMLTMRWPSRPDDHFQV
jgi:hypothetical protein